MKKVLTVILLIIGGIIANILVNFAVLAAWGFNDSGIGLSVFVGIAAVAVICALAAVICKKLSIKRRILLIFTQAPALAIAVTAFVYLAVQYREVMSYTGTGDMWSGLTYGLTTAFFEISSVIFITVLVMTAALALTLGVTYYKKTGQNI